jgi:hypothetical protein
MSMQSVLEASFAVPTTAPDWQSELLLRLGAIEADMLMATGMDEQPVGFPIPGPAFPIQPLGLTRSGS